MRSISSFRAVNKKCTMRFLIIASAVLACAAASPSGGLVAARLAPALPTIPAGDINGAAIDAHVEASDYYRAAIDANRQLNDKVSELHGQAINNAEEHAWRTVDAVKTIEAKWDGAAAGAAPAIAKSLVRNSQLSYAAPVAAPVAAPAAYAAAAPVAAPAAYAAAPVAYASAPVAYAEAPVAYASAPVAYASAPVGYASAPVEYAGAPVAYSAYSPLAESKTVVSQSLSQTHPGAVYGASPFTYAQTW